MTGGVVVLCVGSPDRGDDGIGPAVADQLLDRRLPGVRVVTPAEPVDLLDEELTAGTVLVVDATRSGRLPGTVRVLDLRAGQPLGTRAAASTHALGLDAAVGLLRELGRLPARLVLVGVEADSFETGAALSPAVRAAVPAAVDAVVAALDAGPVHCG